MGANFSLNYIDAIILVIWIIAIIEGVVKGFIKQIFGIVALILACYCSFKFSGFATEKIIEWTQWQGEGVRILAFVITFAVVLLGVSLLGHLLDKIAKVALLGWFNRLLGAIFGWIKWSVLLVILVYLLHILDKIIPFLPADKMAASVLYPVIEKIASLLMPYLPFLGQ